ncbi:MAG: ABC transporter substrate-binding protein [Anaerolineales bacterium]|nr:ABC transporter substrate-binding protein [Anaerolineales bacterium]
MRKNKWRVEYFILIASLLWGLTACGGATPTPAAPAEAPAAAPTEEAAPAEAAAPTEEAAPADEAMATKDVTIKLVENPWSGSQVNVAVAKILLEEKLGYPVEITSIDENAQWSALASGDLDASLEVWPSGHADNAALYIDEQGSVENIGLLGPVGVIGWFMPTYVLKDHPDLATWEGFTTPDAAALFATAETGDKGQFLAGDQSWVQYDADIIKNLGMNFEVVTAGSEEALLAALDSAYSREQPILFYFWTPHSVHAEYDLTQVELPPYSDECYAKISEGGVDCGYPPDDLYKIASAQLAEKAPEAYEFLKNLNYTTQDQIQMIAAVELDGKTPEEAARAWIDANQDVWQAWLP